MDYKRMTAVSLGVILFFVILIGGQEHKAKASDKPNILASDAISIDANSGVILYQKNAYKRAYPASITKIMTALLLMEKVPESDSITLSHNCIMHPKSNAQVFFQHGEVLSRDTALFTMLTISANDVACGIGEHISGTEADFGKLMTEKAKELGAKNTQFVNASGLHDPGYYTTAYDMALITKAAIKNKMILQALNTKRYVINTNFQKNRVVKRTNLSYDNPDSIGEKTGYTDQARNTLVEVDEENGVRIITVILGANKEVTKKTNFEDAQKISRYVFSSRQPVQIVNKDAWSRHITIMGKAVTVVPKTSLQLDENKSVDNHLVTRFSLELKPKPLLYKNGIEKGEKVGVIDVKQNGQIVGHVDAISTKHMTFKKPKAKITKQNQAEAVPATMSVLAFIILIIIYELVIKRRRLSKKYREMD